VTASELAERMGHMAQATPEERPPLAQIVGANVYRLRVLKIPVWSRDKLATLSGLDRETIRRLEEARDPGKDSNSNVRLSTLEGLANALGVDPVELLRWDSTTPP
jgi:transcriptional regulator with XRE-family HTH domain